mmetsp:Transcript_31612/g.48392  ORF Transcript_31612/g.48392 Transcript_31612/m.48392 type:complete len:347 (+) Transcript_31612:3-1043(+)
MDEDFMMDFEDEDSQESLSGNPMLPWYEQVDAVIVTFPKEGNADDPTITGRLKGLKWLATTGEELPANVERILVLDANDLEDLPLTNDDPNLPEGVDVEAFWAGVGRKPTRILLRYGENVQAQAWAEAAAQAAKAAADAAQAARLALEKGEAEKYTEAAISAKESANEATQFVQKELEKTQDIKKKLKDYGAIIDMVSGGKPIEIMSHLGKTNGYETVVWRAGCWGERGVQSILAGAFQWVSAHIAVDAVGGRFWQLMLAERAVQAACGTEQKVKIFAEQEDIALEYCDNEDADSDCILTVNGRPVRHVRLDCRIALVDPERPREFVLLETKPLDTGHEEDGPWFL